MNKMSLNEQAQEILRIANEYGAQSNFFFITTFKRYQVQLKMLNDLEKSLNDNGSMVTKEYVKGRKNLYTNPAIKEYNNTTNSANKTVTTLMKIITSSRNTDMPDEDDDPLLRIIEGKSIE